MAVERLGQLGLRGFFAARLQAAQLSEGERVGPADGSHVPGGAHDAVGQREAAGFGRERVLKGFGLEPRGTAEFPLIVGEDLDLVSLGFGGRGVLVHQSGEETVIGSGVLSGENRMALACESVCGAVLGDASFAFGCARAGG